jgi:hypothetical protein
MAAQQRNTGTASDLFAFDHALEFDTQWGCGTGNGSTRYRALPINDSHVECRRSRYRGHDKPLAFATRATPYSPYDKDSRSSRHWPLVWTASPDRLLVSSSLVPPTRSLSYLAPLRIHACLHETVKYEN